MRYKGFELVHRGFQTGLGESIHKILGGFDLFLCSGQFFTKATEVIDVCLQILRGYVFPGAVLQF